jgi:predicted nucleic acid-binding protein
MAEKIFVDTSAWIALFVKNDKYHAKAASIFKNIQKTNAVLYTSDYVVDETVTTIRVKSNHPYSLLALESILDSRMTVLVYVNPDYFMKIAQLYQKYKEQDFSFTDVSSFVICQSLHIKNVFAFDEDFRIAGFNLL